MTLNNIDGYLDEYRNDDKRIIKDDRQLCLFCMCVCIKKRF